MIFEHVSWNIETNKHKTIKMYKMKDETIVPRGLGQRKKKRNRKNSLLLPAYTKLSYVTSFPCLMISCHDLVVSNSEGYDVYFVINKKNK